MVAMRNLENRNQMIHFIAILNINQLSEVKADIKLHDITWINE